MLVMFLFSMVFHFGVSQADTGERKQFTPRVVTPQGEYNSLGDALAEAQDGDQIQVYGGVIPGPLVVDKRVTLEGIDWPVIDGGGEGTVVKLAAPGIIMRGFEVRGSGVEPDRNHAGIEVTATDVVVEGNRLEDVLFGIYLAQADRGVVRGNQITGKAQYEVARKGDGIRLWYSQDALVEGNHVYTVRDVVVWYSNRVIFRENTIESSRYGVHLMYCDDIVIEANYLNSNSVGIYIMYSHGIEVHKNDIRRQRGPSGYALGLKDSDRVHVWQNLLVDNHSGLFIDGTPFQEQGYALFHDNIIAYNDIGVILLAVVYQASFEGNTFQENTEQVALQGGGNTQITHWLGNYWSDYTGIDTNLDGIGESIYHSERTFDNLTDRAPMLRVLLFSPAAQAVEFASQIFPVFKPQPKLSDEAPIILPGEIPLWADHEQYGTQRSVFLVIGSGMFLLVVGLILWIYTHDNYRWKGVIAHGAEVSS